MNKIMMAELSLSFSMAKKVRDVLEKHAHSKNNFLEILEELLTLFPRVEMWDAADSDRLQIFFIFMGSFSEGFNVSYIISREVQERVADYINLEGEFYAGISRLS